MKPGVDYYLEGFEEWDHKRLCEEVAWQHLERTGWVPTPELMMYLTRSVEEANAKETEKA